jgi:hypothetical protein
VIAMASCFLGSMTLSGCAAAAQDGDLPQAPEPPDSALLSGDRAVTGQIGSYCWSSGSGVARRVRRRRRGRASIGAWGSLSGMRGGRAR